ncbi:hypothetical protein [Actinomadura sp. HBU206391]|uniref:hypothetical protein n=1 Tax=Actinomadura sp. HBU206391 TaxID=2731692 RepID=UPI00164F8469|nr:hypothetical protein [Actinomadura sp. HBU206391]MBC6456653.1 hypothetical protein [Actinomadura sp. HBU206391]
MQDLYQISEAPEASDSLPPASPAGGIVRPLLWVLLVISAAANAVISSTGANMFVGAGFGLVVLACATALVVHHYKHRRR